VSGGISYYNGGVRQGSDTSYSFNASDKLYTKNVTKGSTGHFALREYFGADLQVTRDSKLGLTTLRGEYLQGSQPSIGSNSVSPSFSTITGYSSYASTSSYPYTAFTVGAPGAPAFNVFNRHFNGLYAYFIQNLLHSKHDLLIKYDFYDPNTKVAGADLISSKTINAVSTSTKISQADIKYSTIGLGYVYHMNENVKFVFYYALVTNESTNATNNDKVLAHFKSDIRDNVFTIRAQYKF
jgi:hypothetical protein